MTITKGYICTQKRWAPVPLTNGVRDSVRSRDRTEKVRACGKFPWGDKYLSIVGG